MTQLLTSLRRQPSRTRLQQFGAAIYLRMSFRLIVGWSFQRDDNNLEYMSEPRRIQVHRHFGNLVNLNACRWLHGAVAAFIYVIQGTAH